MIAAPQSWLMPLPHQRLLPFQPAAHSAAGPKSLLFRWLVVASPHGQLDQLIHLRRVQK